MSFLLFVLPLLLHLGTRAANAADTFGSGGNITDGETLVSAGGSFTMGFFSLGVPARRYLGIWFSVSEDTVCWVANGDRPMNGSSGVLVLGDGGRLLLLDGGGQVAWSSNSSGDSASAVAELLNTGNLVVRDRASSHLLWQSFDHPSNTLLPGMKTGKNLWTGAEWYITSWSSPTDPAPGLYRRGLETAVLPENAVWRGNVKTYRSGPWNGLYFNGVPEMVSYANFFTYKLTISSGEVTYGYDAKAGAPLSRIILSDTGMLQRLAWDSSSQGWKTFYSAPRDAWVRTCVAVGVGHEGHVRRTVALDCTTDGFTAVRGVKLPDTHNATAVDSGRIGLEECRARCLANCSCVAYAASDIRGAGHGCIIWSGDIVDVRYVDEGQDLYLRLAKSELAEDAKAGKRKRKMSVRVIATIGVSSAAAAILLCLALIIRRKIRRRRRNLRDARTVHIKNEAVRLEEGRPPNATAVTSIDLATLQKATRSFSPRKVRGQGAFGVVYEGQLPKDHPLLEGLPSRKVAVKRLKLSSSLPNRVLSDYKREVEIVGNLRHDNLARLLAYCNDGDERILVYEYVEKRSLDLYIFGKPSARASLNWEKRLEIIRGICQGVWYLHQGSGENIVHRDLKPSNVLLDQNNVPKIADFGTLKLFHEDQTGAQTVVISPGYASPEYAEHGEMTPKCDVFSFGVVLLEVISGRRNNAIPSVTSQAWRLWEEHRVLDLLDTAVAPPARHRSGSEDLSSELRRCIQIGLLCVQQSPGDRPAISAVLAMLGSKDSLLEQPKGPTKQLGPTGNGGMSLDLESSTVVHLT
uniref:Uncharacterized protein n=1 Tax=Avena sativa TaxID=4498 RepID=A0ACD5V1Z4_AVESA